jgi:hypothetical protein
VTVQAIGCAGNHQQRSVHVGTDADGSSDSLRGDLLRTRLSSTASWHVAMVLWDQRAGLRESPAGLDRVWMATTRSRQPHPVTSVERDHADT